ncbi:sporulation integral membrane protein YtvI [Anaerobacillus sp. MEB173]|uniref:sporulation integral membrane protein YtvI n=1 Tax=Anaerobacillus sp. MEB173 TaxID=3383345 RepID=UPI003F8F399C
MNSELLRISLRLIFVLLTIIILTFVAYFMFKISYPFFIGLLIAILINPFVNFLEQNTKCPRFLSVLLVLTLIIGIVTGLLTLLLAEIISGSNYLAQSVPSHFNILIKHIEAFFTTNIVPLYNQLTIMLHSLDKEHQMTIINYIQSTSTTLSDNVNSAIRSLLNGMTDGMMKLPNAATVFVFSLLATFFISKDWPRLLTTFHKYAPQKIIASGRNIFHDLKGAFFGYLLAQCTLISITTFIVLAGLIILKVEHPITIAIIIGIIDLLPYLGTGLIFIPWIVYTFFSGDQSLTIGLGILYGIIVIQRQIMEPKILSQNIGIDPLATLIALFVGYKLFGFIGLIIGPVLLVFIRTLYRTNIFHDMWNFIIGKKTA